MRLEEREREREIKYCVIITVNNYLTPAIISFLAASLASFGFNDSTGIPKAEKVEFV